MGHVVRSGHERRHKGEDKGNAELTEQSERNGKADRRVGLEARSDCQDGGHNTADNGVRRLCATNRHVADGHELIGTTHEKTGVEVAKDQTDDGAGDDGLIERLQEVELIDSRDKRDDEDQCDLNNGVFHLAPPFICLRIAIKQAFAGLSA
ncbi:unknown [Collinsella sp. CAG:289]|nr:unknown [Collinsella sp. CAG:289]